MEQALHITETDKIRSRLIVKNVIASFLVKGWTAVIVLLMVPLVLNCLGAYQNGVWLTISSLLVWIDQMDIGLGNGLRNRLTAHVAHGKMVEARMVVSSTVAMLVCIVVPIIVLIIPLIWLTDVYEFLNVEPAIIPELRIALTTAVTLVCTTFVMKFISNVYMGMQLPAVSNLLMALGQTISLVGTWLTYISGCATFFAIVIINTVSPLIVYILAYPYTFIRKFPALRPSLKYVNMNSALELGNLGVKFFWLQIAGLIQFMTANLLISNFFSPAMVTPYQIAYRYMSIVMVFFTVVCMPFWNATTDAYERNDIQWIKKSNRKMNWMTLCIAILLSLMVAVSPWVYQIWIGDACEVSFGMTVMMALYIFLLILSMRYSYFLSGIGALRLQLYMTIMTVIFIPAAYIVSHLTHDILWFMAVMCICVAPSVIVHMIQLHKIIDNKATGIWRI
jgi:O-antigen/teichoic acid export membrane protein